jgi:hypothetical protein
VPLHGGGSRLPATVGATKSGSDPAPFAGYKIAGVKATVKAFAKAEEAARVWIAYVFRFSRYFHAILFFFTLFCFSRFFAFHVILQSKHRSQLMTAGTIHVTESDTPGSDDNPTRGPSA